MSAIYMTNTNSTNVPAGSVIPNTINKCCGQSIVWFGNAAIIRRPGYYKVNITVTCTAAEADIVTLNLQKNGVNVPGITASETFSTANTEVRTLSLQGIIRVLCHEGNPIFTLVNSSDVAITTTNVSISIID